MPFKGVFLNARFRVTVWGTKGWIWNYIWIMVVQNVCLEWQGISGDCLRYNRCVLEWQGLSGDHLRYKSVFWNYRFSWLTFRGTKVCFGMTGCLRWLSMVQKVWFWITGSLGWLFEASKMWLFEVQKAGLDLQGFSGDSKRYKMCVFELQVLLVDF